MISSRVLKMLGASVPVSDFLGLPLPRFTTIGVAAVAVEVVGVGSVGIGVAVAAEVLPARVTRHGAASLLVG